MKIQFQRFLMITYFFYLKLLEVCPLGLSQLQVGTRVCGYWSRKSRCLYPGVVSNVHPAGPPNNAGTKSQYLLSLLNVVVTRCDGFTLFRQP